MNMRFFLFAFLALAIGTSASCGRAGAPISSSEAALEKEGREGEVFVQDREIILDRLLD